MFLKNSGTTSTVANNAVRRWKSSFHQSKQQQRKSFANATAIASQGGTSNVCGVSAGSSLSLNSRLLSSSPFTTSFISRLSYRNNYSLAAVNQISLNNKPATGLELKRKMSTKCLAIDNINPNFIAMEYAVRGPLVIRAGEIEKELAAVSKYIAMIIILI